MGGHHSNAGQGRVTPIALSIGVYLAYFDRAVPAGVAPLVKHDFALSDTALGIATATAAAAAYALVAIVLATAGGGGRDRRDAAVIGGMLAWTIGTVALAFTATFGGYVAAELLIGAGQGAFVPAAVTAIVDAGGAPRLGRATARFTSASTLGRSSALLATGAMLAAIVGGRLSLPWLPAPWRGIFLLTALPNLAVGIAIAIILRRAPGVAVAVDDDGSPRSAIMKLVGCFMVAAAPVMLIQAIAAWYPALLVRLAALSQAHAALIAGAATLIAAPLGQHLGGVLLDERPDWRSRPATIVVPALVAALLGLAALTVGQDLIAAIAVLAGVDLVLGVAVAGGLAGIQRLADGRRRRRTNGVYLGLVTLLGVGLGPLLAGRLSDARGATGISLASALAVVGLVALAAAVAGHLLSGGNAATAPDRGSR